MGDQEVIDEIVNEIGRLFTTEDDDRGDEVVFALQYLYRKSSILPEFLKGSDSLLYEALSKMFDVELHPVVLYEESDYDGFYQRKGSFSAAYIFPHAVDEDSGDESSSDSDDDRRHRYRWRNEERYINLFRLHSNTSVTATMWNMLEIRPSVGKEDISARVCL
jgi:hypothetical protein